jgi:hypothetical protein
MGMFKNLKKKEKRVIFIGPGAIFWNIEHSPMKAPL